MIYGNLFLEETDNLFNNNIELNIENVKFNIQFIILESIINESDESLGNKYITINKNNIKAELLLRNKQKGGGSNNNVSKHAVGIKITYPKELNMPEIMVPRKENGDPYIVGDKNKNSKPVKLALQFAKENVNDIRSIFYTSDNKHSFNSYKHLIKSNIDIIENVEGGGDLKIEKYFKSQKEKSKKGKV